jgi:hypothetical protein
MEMKTYPAILSLKLNTEAFEYFNGLRKTYFPTDRNFIDAHLTLFHHLPQKDELLDDLKQIAMSQSIMSLQVQQVVFIGNGVAFKIENKQLHYLHKQMQKQWWSYLTAQDQQGLWPHVTIQNKVPAVEAKKLQEELSRNFQSFEAFGIGLDLWEYHNGPWRHVQTFLFTQA